MKKTISISILLTLVFSGCTLKENDTAVERGIKHTINAPGYVVLGVGALGTAVMMAPFIAVGKGVQAVKGADNTNSENKDPNEKPEENNKNIESQVTVKPYRRKCNNPCCSIKS